MAEQTFRQLCLRMKRPTLVKPTGLVYGLSGRSLDTVGQTEILVPGAGPVSVHVTRGLTHELLLGSDAIEDEQNRHQLGRLPRPEPFGLLLRSQMSP